MTTSFPGSRCTRALLLLAVLVAMSGLVSPWVAHAQQPREMRFGVRINSNTLAWFNQVARRRGRKTATVALARRLLVIAYQILKEETVYDAARLKRRAA